MSPANCKIGLSVGRGRDWVWDNQDHIDGNRATGTITSCDVMKGKIARVQWDSKQAYLQRAYRIGADGAFDLAIKGIKNSMRLFIFTKCKMFSGNQQIV